MEWSAPLPNGLAMGQDGGSVNHQTESERTMAKNSVKEEIKVLGIDLGKRSFSLHGINARGEGFFRRQMGRSKLIEFIASLKPCLVGMEACGGSNYLARKFQEFGHEVRLMAPQFVKPYVKSNKSDAIDAEAICEAVQRPSMRFVPAKSVAQQDLQSLHRARSLTVGQRTAQINQIRGFLHEYGIVLPKGSKIIRERLPAMLKESGNDLTDWMRELLGNLRNVVIQLEERIESYNKKLKQISQDDVRCRRLLTIPGIGVLTATALLAGVGDVSVFKNGRQMAAWLGLVPRQHSTGGKARLLGISKRGDVYLRTLMIHGARAALRCAGRRDDPRSRWVKGIADRSCNNIAAVALANKNARIAWALLKKDENYQAALAA